jgi:hypothetical protein
LKSQIFITAGQSVAATCGSGNKNKLCPNGQNFDVLPFGQVAVEYANTAGRCPAVMKIKPIRAIIDLPQTISAIFY